MGQEGERGQGARERGSEDKNGKRARVDVVREGVRGAVERGLGSRGQEWRRRDS